MKALNLVGKKFGRLTARMVAENKNGNCVWLCDCECGNTANVKAGQLNSGKTNSCGCLHKDTITKHGLSRTPTYVAWQDMRDRCRRPKNEWYARYGGRGITVCDRWLNSFENFLADMGTRPAGLSLDRINFQWIDKGASKMGASQKWCREEDTIRYICGIARNHRKESDR